MSEYKNLEQRIISAYTNTFPDFMPDTDAPVPVMAQELFYSFIKHLYETLFEHPELLYTKLNEDDIFRYRFNRAADKKPELDAAMRSDVKKLEDLIKFLYDMGQLGQIGQDCLIINNSFKISKRYIDILKYCGLVYTCQDKQHYFTYEASGLFSAWRWMAVKESTSLIRFSRCMFKEDYPYLSHIFAELLGDEKAFEDLEKFLTMNGSLR